MSAPWLPDVTYARECFRYNPRTGRLVWRTRPRGHFPSESIWKMWNTRFAMTEAGRKRGNGLGKEYRSVCLNGRHFQSHNIIWLLVTGKHPTQLIDHVNGSGLDNSWTNLREVSHKENCKNHRLGTANKSGVVGVSWCKVARKWRAQITVNGKNLALGRYRNFFDAVCARKSADVKHGFHVNHGSVRPL